MIGATITLTACTGDGFLSSPESQDSTGGPLDEYWNDQGALVAHGVSGVREGGAATLGVRPFANSSGDDLVITKIEVEEAYGLEVTDIVAASPKRRQEGGEVDGIGASRGFPPAILRDEWKYVEPLDGATIDGLGREVNEIRDLWDPMIGVRLTAKYGAAKNIIVHYRWRSTDYVARLPWLFFVDEADAGERFDALEMSQMANTPIKEWPVWGDL
ncbi:MAG: hypothetical protein WKF64_07970 [Ilumatobacteraceae bacterium]